MTYSGPGGASAVNVLNFSFAGGTFDATAVDTIAGLWVAFAKQAIAEDWQVSGVNLFQRRSVDPPEELHSAAASEFGDNTSDVLPPNVAIVLSTSAGASRRRRGRIYLPGIPSEFVSAGGQIDSAYAVGIVAALGDFAESVATDAGWALAVYSRIDNVVRPVTGVSMRELVDTQRRRISRIGE